MPLSGGSWVHCFMFMQLRKNQRMSALPLAERPPCEKEAFVWRECMKEFDYMPDKNISKCDDPRKTYYACINDWRRQSVADKSVPAAPATFTIPRDCVGVSEKLRQCMEIYMFNTEHCTSEMTNLQRCVAKFDPYVAAVVADAENEERRRQVLDRARLEGLISLEKSAMPRSWRNLWGLL